MHHSEPLVPGLSGMLAGGLALFAAALLLPPGLSALFSADPFKLGLPQVVAALVVSGLGMGCFALLRGALLPRMEAMGKASEGLKAELRHQTGLAQGIMGGLPVPFLLVDENERAVRSNQECLRMLELNGKPEDYYGQTLAQIFYNDPGRKTAVGRSIRDGEVFRNLEVEIKGHKGGVRHVLANVFPLYDTERRCIGGLCLYLDMTALKDKERQITQKNESITATARTADELCRALRETASRLSKSVGQTARGSEAQKARLDEMSGGMRQMGEAVLDVARSAAAAARGADESRGQSEQGGRVVGQVIEAIRGVSERTEAMRQRLAELDGQVAGIGQILGVISDIADQTNLLALNAAIEAARAGDAGRGFAVVADEVRKLAEKTMQATGQVASAIGAVQQGAKRAVEVMDGASGAVERSTALADEAGQALAGIRSIAQASADQVRSIAAASEEQSASAEEINRAVENVRAVSDRAARDMAEAADELDGLSRLANELSDAVGRMQSC